MTIKIWNSIYIYIYNGVVSLFTSISQPPSNKTQRERERTGHSQLLPSVYSTSIHRGLILATYINRKEGRRHRLHISQSQYQDFAFLRL
jgi:hypothetical protein